MLVISNHYSFWPFFKLTKYYGRRLGLPIGVAVARGHALLPVRDTASLGTGTRV